MQRDEALGFQIKTLANLIKRRMYGFSSRQGIEEMTGAHGWVIGYLCHNVGREICQRDLEKEFSVRRSTVTNMLQLMEHNGLITRQAVDGDRRLKKIVPTQKAIELHAAFERELDALESSMAEGISPREREAFLATAEKIRKNLTDSEEV